MDFDLSEPTNDLPTATVANLDTTPTSAVVPVSGYSAAAVSAAMQARAAEIGAYEFSFLVAVLLFFIFLVVLAVVVLVRSHEQRKQLLKMGYIYH